MVGGVRDGERTERDGVALLRARRRRSEGEICHDVTFAQRIVQEMQGPTNVWFRWQHYEMCKREKVGIVVEAVVYILI